MVACWNQHQKLNTVHCDLCIVVIVQWSVAVMLHRTGCQSSAWSVERCMDFVGIVCIQ